MAKPPYHLHFSPPPCFDILCGMKPDFFSRYYSDAEEIGKRPFAVWSLGYNRISALTDYSAFLMRHPKDRRFSSGGQRRLKSLVVVRIIHGHGHFESEATGPLPVPANSIMFVFPGVGHTYRYDNDVGWDEEWLEIDPAAALPILQEIGITPADPVSTHPSTLPLGAAFRDLFDCANRTSCSRLVLEAAAHRVFAEAVSARTGDRSTAPTGFIEKACEILTADLSSETSIEELARKVHASPSWLRENFKRATGLSPKRFQMRARMLRAGKLLRETELSIGEIAAEAGFNSLYQFSRYFTDQLGHTPTEYRKRKR